VANYTSRLRREEYRNRVTSRTRKEDGWTRAQMAKPPSRNFWTLDSVRLKTGERDDQDQDLPFELGASEPAGDRRVRRIYRDVSIVLGVLFVIFLYLSVNTAVQVISGGNNLWVSQVPVKKPEKPVVAMVPKKEAGRQTHILLLGSDQRPEDASFRTDVIILLTLDTEKNTLSAVSFPRDLWVKVPPNDQEKINMVMGMGGFEQVQAMFKENFGIQPDYYVMTNFNGFADFIDNRGGIDVQAGGYLQDRCDVPQARGGDCTVDPGLVHMDGHFALWYVRSRHTSSDIDRLRRAQEVLYATLKKTINLASISKMQEMKDELEGNVQTNLSIEKAVAFLPVAVNALNSPDQIKRFAITEDQATPMLSWNGMWVLVPDDAAVKAVLDQAGVRP
jgi:polyisoprenyl-teichoic acid--peptidoglycan teichoic acid transferase